MSDSADVESDCESVTHIGGVALHIGERVIQRCSLCGAKLADSLGCAMPLEKDGKPGKFPVWPTGGLIRVTVGNPTEYRLLDDTDQLPKDSCLELA